MELTREEQALLEGAKGKAAAKSMKILAALGTIYGAERLIPIRSVQIAGVSYANLGDAGLEYLAELAEDGRVAVTTTLNPAGMDLKNWEALGIDAAFAEKQNEVIQAFTAMGAIPCCTCTPYLIGNLPRFGEHVAWSESSAVTFVNAVLGARTNREGGPSALAAAIVGKTPAYGLHLDANRRPTVTVNVDAPVTTLPDFGALGYYIGTACRGQVPYIRGIAEATVDELKSFGAATVTYGSKPLYHMEGITPEAATVDPPTDSISVSPLDLENAYRALNDPTKEIEFVSLGCPHCSIEEIAAIATYLEDKNVKKGITLWIATARPTKELSDVRGYTAVIENAGGTFACDTCMVVAPLKGRFRNVATTSAKACFYCRGKNDMATRLGSFEQCLQAAVTGIWEDAGPPQTAKDA